MRRFPWFGDPSLFVDSSGVKPVIHPSPRFVLIALIVFALAGLALRVSDLRADPPSDLSWSLGEYTDEGFVSYSARNMVLYGTWKTDDFVPFTVYPLNSCLLVLVFRLFGIGFVQVKLISVLAGVASMFILYLLVAEEAGALAGLIAALGFAASFPLVMYNRLGLVESTQILFLLLTGLFFLRGLRNPRQMVISGIMAASAVLFIKLSSVFILPVIAVIFLGELVARRKDLTSARVTLRGLSYWLAGAGAAFVAWATLIFVPHRTDYLRFALRFSVQSALGHPESPIAYLSHVLAHGVQSGLTPRVPYAALLGMLALPVFAFGRKPGMRYLAGWLLASILMLGYMNYRPTRHEMIVIPALLAGFAAALARLLEDGTIVPALNPTVPKTILYSVWLWPLATQTLIYTNRLWGMMRTESDLVILGCSLLGAFAIGFAGYAVLKLGRRGINLRPIAARTIVAALVIALSLRVDFLQYMGWFKNRTHDLVDCSRDLDSILPEGAVLAGAWAPVLLFESRKRALVMHDWANIDDPVGGYGVTHLVSPENGFEEELFWKLYPELMERATEIGRCQIRDVILSVYELPIRGEQPPLPKPSQ